MQARLPNRIYTQFWAFLKKRNWSFTTGVQYAITQVIKDQKC